MLTWQSILENEWFIPITFLACGILSVINGLRRPSSYWILLAIVQFSLFFVLVMSRSLRRSKIFPGVLLCTIFGAELIRSWHRYANPNDRFISTALWGSVFVGSIIGLFIRYRERRQDNATDQRQDITRLCL